MINPVNMKQKSLTRKVSPKEKYTGCNLMVQGGNGNPYMGTFYIDYNEVKVSQSDTYFSDHIEIFPNPADEIVNIRNITGRSTIVIVDLAGKTVYSTLTSGQSETIDISDFPKGVYFVKIQSGDSVHACKIIK